MDSPIVRLAAIHQEIALVRAGTATTFTEFSATRDAEPADTSTLIPPNDLGRLGDHPGDAPNELPDLLKLLVEAPDPHEVRHPGRHARKHRANRSIPAAIGRQWISDTSPHVLEHVGVRPDLLVGPALLQDRCEFPAMLGLVLRRLGRRVDAQASG
jgi:hypothetical protein